MKGMGKEEDGVFISSKETDNDKFVPATVETYISTISPLAQTRINAWIKDNTKLASQNPEKYIEELEKVISQEQYAAFYFNRALESGSMNGEDLWIDSVFAAIGSTLAQNKERCGLWEQEVKLELKQDGEKIVVDQITLETKSGGKTRVDFMTMDNNGTIEIYEAKSSDTAPLTKKQKNAFPEIEDSGATVKGKGKPPFTGGTEITPTKIKIKRPK